MPSLPDLGMAAFRSDEWRFGAVCVVVFGVTVVPSFFAYLVAKRRNDQKFKIALKEVDRKLEEVRIRRQKITGKGPKRWTQKPK